jgi:hypothetical protein
MRVLMSEAGLAEVAEVARGRALFGRYVFYRASHA